MNGITVKQLRDKCNEAISDGFENHIVAISDDEEGNGYHPIYEGFSEKGDLFKGKYAPWLSGLKPEDDFIILS